MSVRCLRLLITTLEEERSIYSNQGKAQQPVCQLVIPICTDHPQNKPLCVKEKNNKSNKINIGQDFLKTEDYKETD